MAFNLHKLARATEFSFDLSSIGLVRCKPLSSNLMAQAWKRIKTPDFESRELARWLLGEMAKRPTVENFQEADPIEGNSLTTEQLIAVTNQELESFSERLVQKNLYLVRAHDYVANAVRADRQTNRAMWVAGLSLFVSAIGLVASSYFSFQSYADAQSSDEKENSQIKVFKESINTLVTEQRAERAEVLKQIGDANRNVPKAKK